MLNFLKHNRLFLKKMPLGIVLLSNEKFAELFSEVLFLHIISMCFISSRDFRGYQGFFPICANDRSVYSQYFFCFFSFRCWFLGYFRFIYRTAYSFIK